MNKNKSKYIKPKIKSSSVKTINLYNRDPSRFIDTNRVLIAINTL